MNSHIKTATFLVDFLENKYSIFGLKFGFDPLLNFIPIFGNVIAFMLSLYILWIAKEAHIPQNIRSQMVGNIVLDFLIGTIPVAGHIADFFYKANVKNLELLKKYAPADITDGEVAYSY